jgi:hypothetical protein
MSDFVDEQRKAQNNKWNDLFGGNALTIREEDKPMYKQFYKKLAMEFHPDKIGGDTKAMQLVNELKKNWGV